MSDDRSQRESIN